MGYIANPQDAGATDALCADFLCEED